MAKQNEPLTAQPPDQRPLTGSQASRLASLTGLNPKELSGLSVAQIGEKFRWKIDPEILFFRRICGRVVKLDPLTGDELPVPFATVHVEDTDCSFLGFFPVENPWAWFFPIFCHREDIGTTVTDACGNFCVWIPRFEIDWILRLRRERICIPEVFVKPNLSDIIRFVEEAPVRPQPIPDPPPFVSKLTAQVRQRLEQTVGQKTVDRLIALEKSAALGGSSAQRQRLLASSAFPMGLTPPLSKEFHVMGSQPMAMDGKAKHADAVKHTLAARLNLNPSVVKDFDLARFVGPFFRCFDVIVPEWVPILDVPDITFRVTQDVNGDGTQEVIYSEGYFDVRWNTGNMPDVTLVASPIAIASRTCRTPDVPCADKPAIEFAGLMPLDPSFNDATSGYAVRPNRPHPTGLYVDPGPYPTGRAPYCNELQIYGCNRVKNAAYYRVRYQYTDPMGNTSPQASFKLSWSLHRFVAGVLQEIFTTFDADGWYEVLKASDNWFPDLLLLEWRTWESPDGLYTLTLEIADTAKNVIGTSASVGIRVDNTPPKADFTGLGWRYSDVGGSFTGLSLDCPVITRDSGRAIDIQVSYSASASSFRSVSISAGACGAGSSIAPTSDISTLQHWTTDANFDNSVSNSAIFQIPAGSLEGSYTFGLEADTRAFNPSGGDGGDSPLVEWNYNVVYKYKSSLLAVAVVNA